MYIYFNKKERKWIPTGVYVKPEYWDSKLRKVKRSHTNSFNLNSKLNSLKSKLERTEAKAVFDKGYITAKEVYAVFENDNVSLSTYQTGQSFNNFYSNMLKKDYKLKASTIADKEKTLRKLDDFKNPLHYHHITNFLLNDFDEWLTQQNLSESTRKKHHKNIKTYLTKYLEEGIENNLFNPKDDPYKEFKIGRIKGNRTDLTMEEIKRIEDLNFRENSKISFYRDVFIFSCYTGLRISDLEDLNTKHLQYSNKNGFEITLHRMRKVDKEVYLPLRKLFQGKPEEILLKYLTVKDFQECVSNNNHRTVFKGIERNDGNVKLKTIARDAKINKTLSWHVGRHTFGTNMAEISEDSVLIMNLMGISKPDTAMIYIHASKERTRNKLDAINWEKMQ